ncbi:MAG: sulfatase-like hydrolase/transferase [Candidatus Alcyoniella australis]|nr:sulfatase-like hydrolase/transferase [Candidatus Alcyoniella australis]
MSRGPRPELTARATALRGAAAGALVYLTFFVFCLALSAGFAVMGVTSERVSDLVREHYSGLIVVQEFKILAAYSCIGLLIGAWGALSGRALARTRGRTAIRRAWPWAVGLALATEALMLSRALTDTPATYAPWFYDQGGGLRALQLLFTEHAHPAIFSATLAGLYAAGPLLWAAQIVRSGRTRETLGRLRALTRPWALVLLSIVVGALIYRHCDLAPRERPDQPDVLILAADSLRPDHLGLEYARQTSPNIDRLVAEQAAFFIQAYSPLARTFPAWASILSGQAPKDHGIRGMFPRHDQTRLEHSLARVLSESGWHSVVLADYAGDIFPRFDAGFDLTRAPSFNMRELVRQHVLEGHRLLLPYLQGRTGRVLFPEIGEFPQMSDPRLLGRAVIDQLERNRDRPLFLAAFFSVTHFPYASPHPWYKAFGDPDYRGPARFHKPVAPGEQISDPREVQRITDLFDSSILAFDHQLGLIIDYLKKEGRWNNTLLIITADHGENLFEHGEDFGHGDHFRGMHSLRVPLIVKLPGGNTVGSIKGLSSLLDIAPTVARACGLELGWPTEGISLLPALRSGAALPERALYFESGIWFTDVSPEYFQERRIPYPDISRIGRIDFKHGHLVTIDRGYEALINLAKHRMRFDGRYKLIYIPTREGVRWELYDVLADPAELRDLAPASLQPLNMLQHDLLRWIGSEPGIELSNSFALPAS